MSRAIQVVIGSALLLLVLFPVYRLLDPVTTGTAGRATIALADLSYELSWIGLLLIAPAGILGAVFITPQVLERVSSRTRALLTLPRAHVWFAACAVAGAVITAAFSLLILDGKPNLIDASVQLLHARYWAEGMLAGPNDWTGAFWAVQNSLFTDNGWVSQYPPGHIALLTPFLRAGVPWLLGPLLVFIAIWSAGALAEQLYPHDPVLPRIATLLLAFCPFFLCLSGAYMNHATAAACIMLGAYSWIRAWRGFAGWALLAGFVLALSLATRPLSTLAVSLALIGLTAAVWRGSFRRLMRCSMWAAFGAAPVLVAWFGYNAFFLGFPFRLGYTAAHGAGMALGFHRDPWGNLYGAREALAYTSSDLVTLGTYLLESPVSAIAIIGLYLVTAHSLRPGTWFLLALAIAPVLSNVLYWHHGIFMGPRMLHEAAPAWVLLFVAAAVGLVRLAQTWAPIAGRYHASGAAAFVLVGSTALGIGYLAPQRAFSYGGELISAEQVFVSDVQRPALVFVHDSWYSGIATTLISNSLRLDAVDTLLRQNSTCLVHHYSRALEGGDTSRAATILSQLDTVPFAERALPIVGGVRSLPSQAVTQPCRREIMSDRLGGTDLTRLLWQADLHGSESTSQGILVARDRGPERNAAMLRAHPARTPYLYIGPYDGANTLWEYGSGMDFLWGSGAGYRADTGTGGS